MKKENKSWFGRHKILTVLLGVVIFFILIALIPTNNSETEEDLTGSKKDTYSIKELEEFRVELLDHQKRFREMNHDYETNYRIFSDEIYKDRQTGLYEDDVLIKINQDIKENMKRSCLYSLQFMDEYNKWLDQNEQKINFVFSDCLYYESCFDSYFKLFVEENIKIANSCLNLLSKNDLEPNDFFYPLCRIDAEFQLDYLRCHDPVDSSTKKGCVVQPFTGDLSSCL